MRTSLCLVASDAAVSLAHIGPLLTTCGLDVWTASSAEACLSDSRSSGVLCLIVDMPSEEAEECLEVLRSSHIRAPALLITDTEGKELSRTNADWIDVLQRPVNIRVLLGWVESICAAHLMLERSRSLYRQLSPAA